jgi:hypothetical protein
MKTKFFSTSLIFLFCSTGLIRAQVVNTEFGSIKAWSGTCKVIIIDSTTESRTEYIFEGSAVLKNEIDMSPYNMSWPNPALSAGDINTANFEDMMKASKAQEDKWKVWNARITVSKRVKYQDEVSSADYTCSFTKTEKLKFQIAIHGNTVYLVPGIAFSEVLDCTGTEDEAPVQEKKDERLMLDNFQVTTITPDDGSKRLTGERIIYEDTKRILVRWDFSPDK